MLSYYTQRKKHTWKAWKFVYTPLKACESNLWQYIVEEAENRASSSSPALITIEARPLSSCSFYLSA